MLKQDWWQVVDSNWDNLCAIVDGYHPGRRIRESNMRITALAAEQACEAIRNAVAEEYKDELESPLRKFMIAKDLRDDRTISTLLSQTYFGVPESTSCWSIPGFGKLCDLLDDPIEDEGENCG